MKNTIIYIVLLVFVLLPGREGWSQDVSNLVQAAVDSANRPNQDRLRDGERKPAQLLSFFGVEQGQTVAELQTGSGYFAHILANFVGPAGLVYAHNNGFLNRQYGQNSPLTRRIDERQLSNVIEIATELDDLGFDPESLDVLFMILDYHDTVWLGTDRPKMNSGILSALKPGGIFAITDHHAEPGSGVRDVETLHRIDRQIVIDEILESGFELVDEADFLRNTEPRTLNIFTEGLRGYTDQFVLKFRKPVKVSDVTLDRPVSERSLMTAAEIAP